MQKSIKVYEKYQAIRHLIRSGDILLCSGNSTFSKLIKRFTGSKWSHAGLIVWWEEIDTIMVLESVESIGVRTVPLFKYIKEYEGDITICRHKEYSHEMINRMKKHAMSLMGHQYDNAEIARIAARIAFMSASNKIRYTPVHDNTYICSEYVDVCFEAVGIKLCHDPRGFIAPKNIAEDPKITIEFEFPYDLNAYRFPTPFSVVV
jgi:Permuted papain-like amidase enzyme, YaeF/YiiX, C92 family